MESIKMVKKYPCEECDYKATQKGSLTTQYECEYFTIAESHN